MIRSKTNSIRSGKYIFQPTKFDKEDNLCCSLYRINAHKKKVCKLTGTYFFNEDRFKINWKEDNWILNRKHKDLINFFLNEYDWAPITN